MNIYSVKIMGLTNEKTGEEKFVCAAFPSACGKTNLAMIQPTIPGYKVRVVGKCTTTKLSNRGFNFLPYKVCEEINKCVCENFRRY